MRTQQRRSVRLKRAQTLRRPRIFQKVGYVVFFTVAMDLMPCLLEGHQFFNPYFLPNMWQGYIAIALALCVAAFVTYLIVTMRQERGIGGPLLESFLFGLLFVVGLWLIIEMRFAYGPPPTVRFHHYEKNLKAALDRNPKKWRTHGWYPYMIRVVVMLGGIELVMKMIAKWRAEAKGPHPDTLQQKATKPHPQTKGRPGEWIACLAVTVIFLLLYGWQRFDQGRKILVGPELTNVKVKQYDVVLLNQAGSKWETIEPNKLFPH